MFINLKESEFIRLMTFMKGRMALYIFSLISKNIIQASLWIVTAFVFKDALNAAINGNMDLLVRAIIIISVYIVLITTLAPALNYAFCYCVRSAMKTLRQKIFTHMQEVTISGYERYHSGDIISRVTNDVNEMEKVYSEHISTLINTTIYGVGCIVSMLILDWRFAVIQIILGIISLFVTKMFSTSIRDISERLQKKFGVLTERLTDLLAGYHEIKIFHLAEPILDSFSKENKGVTELNIKYHKKIGKLESTNNLLNMMSIAIIVSMGSLMVLWGYADYGTVWAAAQLLNGVVFLFMQMGNFVSRLQGSLAGANRVFELLDEPIEPERYNISLVKGGNSMLEMKEVVFSYNEDKRILNGVDITIARGQMAALVGTSGGGKSTIIKLLLGFYPLDAGAILIDGKPMSQYKLSQLRDMMAYVSQDAYLFDGTIEENIRMGCPNALEIDVINAAKAANAHDFIMEMAEAYNTQVGERGIRLSGGQKQRIAIARAILKNAPVLLLDEATSALDSESEQFVQEALNVLMKGRTVLVIAHRLSTIKNADMIYVIDEGKVVEHGRHEELVLQAGLYSTLHKLQFTA